MIIAGIIPARFGSSRFPGKPLAMIGNMTMIERVYRQAGKSSLLNLIAVATDDNRIYDTVVSFGGKAVMTNAGHLTGTERCAEAVSLLGISADAVINIQGDEPFLEPSQIDRVAELLANPEVEIATLVRKPVSGDEIKKKQAVKAILNQNGRAMYFSRLPVPYCNENLPFEQSPHFIHVGIYGYQIGILKKIVLLKQSPLELAESLEQLRWLENGFDIYASISPIVSHAVDTPSDLEELKKFYRL